MSKIRVLVLAAVLLTAFLFLISQNEHISSTLVPSRQTAAPIVVQPSAVTEKDPVTVRETVIQTQVQWATKTTTASAAAATPTKTKVVVVLPKDKRTGGDFGFRDGGWLEAAIANRQEYADAHGYEFIWQNLAEFETEYKADACWAKIAALQDAWIKYPDVDWIWMLDADAIIMNGDIDLHDYLLSHEALKRVVMPDQEIKIPGGAKIDEQNKTVRTRKDVVPEELEFLIAKDGNGINAGSFFVKRTAFMGGLVDFWKDPYLMRAGFGYREQDALGHLMLFHEQFLNRVGIIPQKLVNAYVDRLEPEDLVVHFAGCSFYKERDCDALFKEKYNARVRPKSIVGKKAENEGEKESEKEGEKESEEGEKEGELAH